MATIKNKCWIIMGLNCIFATFLFTFNGIKWMNDFIEDIDEKKRIVDKRNTTISEHCIDYEMDDTYYKCTIDNPCYFNCSYLKSNLHIKKSQCEYNEIDYDPLQVTCLSIFLFLMLCGFYRCSYLTIRFCISKATLNYTILSMPRCYINKKVKDNLCNY